MSERKSYAPHFALLLLAAFVATSILWPWPTPEPGCFQSAARDPFSLSPAPHRPQLGVHRSRLAVRRDTAAGRVGSQVDVTEFLERLAVVAKIDGRYSLAAVSGPPAAPRLSGPELVELEQAAGPQWRDLHAELALESASAGASVDQLETAAADDPAQGDWVVPQALLERLAQLQRHAACRDWARATAERVKQLGGDESAAREAISALQAHTQTAETLAASLGNREVASELRRARYAVLRHVALWNGLAQLQANSRGAIPVAVYRTNDLIPSLRRVADTLKGSPYEAGWRDYLLLAALEDTALQVSQSDGNAALARRVLRRIESPALNEAQRRFLQLPAYRELVAELRRLADEPLDPQEMLAKLEAYEASGRISLASLLAVDLDRLRLSPRDDERALAHQLESYYRNTNVRMSVSPDLLTKLAAGQHQQQGAVQGTMFGVPYQGCQVANTTTTVTVLPGVQPVQLLIETQGRVVADTSASQGIVTTQNRSVSQFTVKKRIEFNADGLRYFPAEVTVASQQALRDIETGFDGVPVMGGLMRNITARRYEDRRAEALAITRQRLSTEVAAATDAQADAQLAQLQHQLQRNVLIPLQRLGLSPATVVERPADDRLNVRWRLATYRQLGAHTPRPVPPADSLASVQLHETALNNLLDRLQLAGRELSLTELWQAATPDLAREHRLVPTPAGSAHSNHFDLRLKFAAYDPLQVQCGPGKLRATLRLASLDAGYFHWERLTIHADFEPVRQGRNVHLVRSGPVVVVGAQLTPSQQNILQTMLSSLLPRDTGLPLAPPALLDHARLADVAVTQAVIEDGWIGLALGPAESVRTTRRGDRDAHFTR